MYCLKSHKKTDYRVAGFSALAVVTEQCSVSHYTGLQPIAPRPLQKFLGVVSRLRERVAVGVSCGQLRDELEKCVMRREVIWRAT